MVVLLLFHSALKLLRLSDIKYMSVLDTCAVFRAWIGDRCPDCGLGAGANQLSGREDKGR